jgi:formylglycine-generating enzyme
MSGEWVSVWHNPTSYADSATTNPQGPVKGTKKVHRDSTYHCPPHLIRPAYRAADALDKAYSVPGFRLVAEKK